MQSVLFKRGHGRVVFPFRNSPNVSLTSMATEVQLVQWCEALGNNLMSLNSVCTPKYFLHTVMEFASWLVGLVTYQSLGVNYNWMRFLFSEIQTRDDLLLHELHMPTTNLPPLV